MSDDAPRIVHRDAHLLVVHKPAHLATTAPSGPSLTAWVTAELGRAAHPTSRLDAEVTGLVTFALTPRAIETLKQARAHGRYGRGYLALARGAPPLAEGEWTLSIAIASTDRRLRRALSEGERGERAQRARTSFTLRAQAGGACALWLTPHTGRTHQLRVHASAAGLPLLGDVRYGGPKRIVLPSGRVLTARRVMLHCAWLRVPSPADPSVFVELEAEAPPDLRELWAGLGGEPSALSPSQPPSGSPSQSQ